MDTPSQVDPRAVLGNQPGQGRPSAWTTGHTWIANSPELNVAEHAVPAIAGKTQIATGSYTLTQLKKIANQQWKAYTEASVNASILSMSARLKAVIERKGEYLLKGQDY